MKAERGLGKGLQALLGDAALLEREENNIMLPISQIETSANQPRKYFDGEALEELAESIRVHGVIQPITVRRLSSGYYQIVAGERRWRASRLAGLSEIPAIIITADDKTAMELALIENLQREDLNPIEEAEGYKSLCEEYGMTQELVSECVGKSRSAVANAMRILELPEELRELVASKKLSSGHARAILKLKENEDRVLAAKVILDRNLNVRQAEALAKRMAETPKEKKMSRVDGVNYMEEIEKTISGRMGRKVNIIPGRKKGKVEIEFYGKEDMEALLDFLLKSDFSRGGRS